MDILFQIIISHHEVIQNVINFLSVFILASKLIPTLRIFGYLAQAITVFLTIVNHYLETSQKGKEIAQNSNVDERVRALLASSEPVG